MSYALRDSPTHVGSRTICNRDDLIPAATEEKRGPLKGKKVTKLKARVGPLDLGKLMVSHAEPTGIAT